MLILLFKQTGPFTQKMRGVNIYNSYLFRQLFPPKSHSFCFSQLHSLKHIMQKYHTTEAKFKQKMEWSDIDLNL